MPHAKPDVSWTDQVPGHPANLVWGEMTDQELQDAATSVGVKGTSLSRRSLLDQIGRDMPDGWKWEGE